jgi:hypothetical protein
LSGKEEKYLHTGNEDDLKGEERRGFTTRKKCGRLHAVHAAVRIRQQK